MAIPQHFIDELVARADVVDVVGRYVQLKKTGANFSGLCPFHSEKSPSFTVSPSKQFYHCFGCGQHGNVIGFLMAHTGAGFVEVVHDLAQQYGLSVPEDERSAAERERAAQARQQRATLTDVLARAGEAYKAHLRQSPRAIAYLKARGLSGAIAQRFGLGYAPEGWRPLASVFADYTDPLLAESGLVIVGEDDADKRYDRFRDRIMFPIRDVKGQVIGFGGRVLGDEKPKYLNSPETPVFHKGRELYGLFEARQAIREAGHALVTEGYMDVVALAQGGIGNAVATLGTACTPEHVQKLFRFTDQIVFSFDGDAAGRRAAHKALQVALPFASDLRSIKFLFLPPEHDPDSYVRAHGADAFRDAARQALPLSRFLLDAAADGVDLSSAEGRAHMAQRAGALWSQLPVGALAPQLLADIATQVHMAPAELQALWQRTLARTAPAPGGGAAAGAGRDSAFDSNKKRVDQGQRPISPQNRARPPLHGRPQPASAADHAVRLLLAHLDLWETLTDEQHGLLSALPPPHGPLCRWLEARWQEHGPLAWGALADALPGQPFEDFARALMQRHVALVAQPQPTAEAQAELQSALDGLLDEALARDAEAALAEGDLQALRHALQRRAALVRARTGPRPQGG